MVQEGPPETGQTDTLDRGLGYPALGLPHLSQEEAGSLKMLQGKEAMGPQRPPSIAKTGPTWMRGSPSPALAG
ncbi:hypothetical protein FKM82_015409 [Ascaphus truei]